MSKSPPSMDMWLYHTWVSFDNDLNSGYSESMQFKVEARFLEYVKNWRMSDEEEAANLGMKEMTFGLPLETPGVPTLQYFVHRAVLDEIINRADPEGDKKMESRTTFKWKDNHTVRHNIGNEFTFDPKQETVPNAENEKGKATVVEETNDAMKKIIRNAEIYLKKRDYVKMYKWLEHVDC